MYELNKTQIKSAEIFGRLAPNGMPVKIDDYTITNTYAILKFKLPIPAEVEADAVDDAAARQLVKDVEETAGAYHQILTADETIPHPKDSKITLEKYGHCYYNADIVSRVKRTLGGKDVYYREIIMNSTYAIVIQGLCGWGMVLPVRVPM